MNLQRKPRLQSKFRTPKHDLLEEFVTPFLERLIETADAPLKVHYDRLLRLPQKAKDLWVPRFTWRSLSAAESSGPRVGLFTGFRPGEEVLGAAATHWLFDLPPHPDLHALSVLAYPLSDPQAVFGAARPETPHLLAELGHHNRRLPLYLIEREFGTKEFHLAVALTWGASPVWSAAAAGPPWFKEIVAESVLAARGSGEGSYPPLSRAAGGLEGFSGRIEGRRVQPLEVVFQVPAGEKDFDPALRRALECLLENYRAVWSGRFGI